jgi:hypothetical protein
MNTYQVLVKGHKSGPFTKTFQAESLESALARVKRSEVNADSWDMCPIWSGERRVDLTAKFEHKKLSVTIVLVKE